MLDHPWLTMPANYDYKLTPEEHQKAKSTKESEAQSDYYANKEMGKLTDSEGEYLPADEEDYIDGSTREDKL